jgi:hypothetical protein
MTESLQACKRRWLLAMLLMVVAPTLPVSAQVWNAADSEFIVGFMPSYGADSTTELRLELVSERPCSVTVSYPLGSPTFQQTYALLARSPLAVAMPREAASGWVADASLTNAIHVKATDLIGCRLVSYLSTGGSMETTLALPISSLGTYYRVLTYHGAGLSSADRAGVLIVGTADNTSVQFSPTATVLGGHAAGAMYGFALNMGQGKWLISADSSSAGDLSGSTILATAPLAVFVGHIATKVPTASGYYDQLFEALPPVSSWGTDYILPNIPGRTSGTRYRVMADQPGTAVTGTGFNPPVLVAGGTAESPSLAGHYRLTSNKPILVAQFMTGVQAEGGLYGDPAMQFLTPISAFTETRSVIASYIQSATDSMTISIVALQQAADSIKINGQVLGASHFVSVLSTPYVVAHVAVAPGPITTESPGSVHGLYLTSAGVGAGALENGTLPFTLYTCCAGLTGNVDCDLNDGVDISDLSAMIDNLYISFAPLCCKKEANVDGSVDGNIDISDLSALIDYLYINFTPPAACR